MVLSLPYSPGAGARGSPHCLVQESCGQSCMPRLPKEARESRNVESKKNIWTLSFNIPSLIQTRVVKPYHFSFFRTDTRSASSPDGFFRRVLRDAITGGIDPRELLGWAKDNINRQGGGVVGISWLFPILHLCPRHFRTVLSR